MLFTLTFSVGFTSKAFAKYTLVFSQTLQFCNYSRQIVFLQSTELISRPTFNNMISSIAIWISLVVIYI